MTLWEEKQKALVQGYENGGNNGGYFVVKNVQFSQDKPNIRKDIWLLATGLSPS